MTVTTVTTSTRDDATGVADALRRLLAALEELGIETDGVTPGTQLRADLDIDSAELVEIVASLAGGRAPDGKALKEVRTVGRLAEFIAAH